MCCKLVRTSVFCCQPVCVWSSTQYSQWALLAAIISEGDATQLNWRQKRQQRFDQRLASAYHVAISVPLPLYSHPHPASPWCCSYQMDSLLIQPLTSFMFLYGNNFMNVDSQSLKIKFVISCSSVSLICQCIFIVCRSVTFSSFGTGSVWHTSWLSPAAGEWWAWQYACCFAVPLTLWNNGEGSSSCYGWSRKTGEGDSGQVMRRQEMEPGTW